MQATMKLLEKALEINSAAYWSKKLGLSRTTISNSKYRGQLSPAIAGALAAEVDPDNWKDWVICAAIESEKDSKAVEILRKALNRG